MQKYFASYFGAIGGVSGVIRKVTRLYRSQGIMGLLFKLGYVLRYGFINPATGSAGYDRNDYIEWIKRYGALAGVRLREAEVNIPELMSGPLISVIMPTYNSNPEWLLEAVDSVLRQSYSNWQLCIADDASTKPETVAALECIARKDKRINIVFRAENGHISAASNSALELAEGEWVALLDHDDLLAQDALYHVAMAIIRKPHVQMIYTDEDKIDFQGRRSGPYFKTEWNPDLFYSHNMFCHLGVYRRSLVRSVGGFRCGYEGAQDYDLALRCIENIDATDIHHIPFVLYHWRIHRDSTAYSPDAKPYAMEAGERALNEHFQRSGVSGSVELLETNYRAKYDVMAGSALVSIIIPTRNREDLVRRCVDSIFGKTEYKNYEIIIIDNGSDSADAIAYFAELHGSGAARVIRDDRDFNYSAINNSAVNAARGEFVCLVNNDIEVISPGWLGEMLGHALRPGAGAVGARLLYPDGTLQHGGIILGINGVAGHSHKGIPGCEAGYAGRARVISRVSAVTGACLLVRKSIYKEVSGLNEQDLSVAYNDVDFCLRLQEAGYFNIWTPYAELYHHESASRGYEDSPEKISRHDREKAYMRERWAETLDADPFYSANLTVEYEDFSLAWPPRV